MRLFVDVDDTLILWPKVEESRGLFVSGEPKPNPAVIGFVERLRAFHREELTVVIWSLGGADYARKHATPTATVRPCVGQDADPCGARRPVH